MADLLVRGVDESVVPALKEMFERRSGRAKVADGDRLFEAEVAP
jgi:hypothetical protein